MMGHLSRHVFEVRKRREIPAAVLHCMAGGACIVVHRVADELRAALDAAGYVSQEQRDRAWIERELGDVPATGPNRRVLHGEFPLDAMIDTSQRQQRSEPGSWAY